MPTGAFRPIRANDARHRRNTTGATCPAAFRRGTKPSGIRRAGFATAIDARARIRAARRTRAPQRPHWPRHPHTENNREPACEETSD
ncbi:hypothetical protein DIS09_16750 [Burkholderia pseudomallei]|nr:hypothetical protein BOC35_16950 [Burkholderia pseudomallei]ARK55045.1 hypothetical protein BOC36_19455 [Burkholderia pseudomallei]ARK62542.1 hypothetical protein BOC37_22025 [Burkholderia pseudomallei]ARK78495.1 hypothetical protein BOC39_35645 [Burkholderia pseudomallei]ARK80513.1 hypothetical protein BOC40_08830 [Burkholderia pseudomallei]